MIDVLLIACVACAAAPSVVRAPRAASLLTLAALALAPIVLALELGSDRLGPVGDHPALAVVGAVAGVAFTALVARWLRDRAWLFAPLVAGCVALRVPIDLGEEDTALLLPLYVVIGATAMLMAWERWHDDPAETLRFHVRPPGRVELAVVLVVIAYACAALYTDDTQEAVQTTTTFLVPFLVMLRQIIAAPWDRRALRWSAGAAVLVAGADAAVAVAEYATRRPVLNPQGFALAPDSFLRVDGILPDPNSSGRILAVAIVGVAAVLLWERDSRRMLLLTGLVVLLGAGLVVTLSQSSYLALTVGLLVVLALRLEPPPSFVGGVIALLLIGGIGYMAAGPGADRSIDAVTSGRSELVDLAVDLGEERPLQGFGAGSFVRQYRERVSTGQSLGTSRSHTVPLTVLAEQGAIGLLVYLLAQWAALSTLLDRRRLPREERDDPIAGPATCAAVAGAYVTVLVHSLLNPSFWEDPIVWALLGVAVALHLGTRPAPVARRASAVT